MAEKKKSDRYIKLHLKMLDWEWYHDVNTFRLFLHCLLKANWKPGSWHGIDYEPGQFITSLQTLANETGLSIQQVRTALAKLKSTGEVTDYQQGKSRIITVCNWISYQSGNKVSNSKVTTDIEGINYNSLSSTNNNINYNSLSFTDTYIGREISIENDEKLNKAFADFVEMRKEIKKPMSELAIQRAINRLNELSGGDSDVAVKIIDQSIFYGWQGLFPLKQETTDSNSKTQVKPKPNPKLKKNQIGTGNRTGTNYDDLAKDLMG